MEPDNGLADDPGPLVDAEEILYFKCDTCGEEHEQLQPCTFTLIVDNEDLEKQRWSVMRGWLMKRCPKCQALVRTKGM